MPRSVGEGGIRLRDYEDVDDFMKLVQSDLEHVYLPAQANHYKVHHSAWSSLQRSPIEMRTERRGRWRLLRGGVA